MHDQYYDELLNINTKAETKGEISSFHYYPYEPTPYSALETLFSDFAFSREDRLIDFGCGKGRLPIYSHYLFNVTVIGIEMNEMFYKKAIENRSRYLDKTKNRHDNLHFYCCLAEEYPIDPHDNYFYFFNPFSIQIFMKTINNILRSVEKSDREVNLILYYGSHDYIFYLEYQTAFVLKKEVILPGLYEHNPNERFLIYQLKRD